MAPLPMAALPTGLDRIVMLMTGEDVHSRRDSRFPKTQQARCLLTLAPSGVDTAQLDELSVASTYEPEEED
jgi:aspartyl-tRNA synthetase